MKIIYKQPKREAFGSLSQFGITDCYLKRLLFLVDNRNTTKREHHHNGFELHIITKGCQRYQVGKNLYELEAGNYLLIGPDVPHRIIASDVCTEKYSITFQFRTELAVKCCKGQMSDRMWSDIGFMMQEAKNGREMSGFLIENSILEMIISVLRQAGFEEKEMENHREENPVLELAKTYIDDNIEQSPTVGMVAEYCHLSTKQLARIFDSVEQISPGEYIGKKRMEKIEQLLADREMSLKEISEKMNFGSEYYFNTFFKKKAGMPPGEYRKMIGK